MDKNNELLPCPFCGGPVELERAEDTRSEIYGVRKWWVVVCRNTSNLGGTCAIQQIPSASEEAAIERWNRRASPADQVEDARGHGIRGVPRAAFGPHTESDRIDHCTACGAENEPQKDDICPSCCAANSLVSTWGEFQHERYRNGQRYANNGPQWWEDGPQPAIDAAMSASKGATNA